MLAQTTASSAACLRVVQNENTEEHMPQVERRAEVVWEGNLMQGHGTIASSSSGALQNMPVTWASRVERPDGKTSPEELIAAAHAECYAMSLSHTLAQAGNPAQRLNVSAVCTLEVSPSGPKIAAMTLTARGTVPGLDQAGFEKAAQTAEQNCPVSNALRGSLKISVQAQLE
jgi:osmotically inducible protein OsmC